MIETVKEIISIINKEGYEAYLIGGSSRDFLLHIPFTDIDIATNCPLDIIEHLFTIYESKGKSLGSIKIIYNNLVVEITRFREEYYKDDSIYPHIKRYVDSPILDSSRRDFTINAIYYNPVTGIIIDPYKWVNDLDNKTIRFIGDPQTRIHEDPTRIIRAIRFSQKLGFTIEPKTRQAIYNNIHELERIGKIKYNKEVEKLISDIGKEKALHALKDFNLTYEEF